MANKRLGAVASVGPGWAHVIDSTYQVKKGDAGKTFFIDADSTGSYIISLPQLSTKIAGWSATFIVRAIGGSNLLEILGYGVPTGGGSGTDENSCNILQFASREAATGVTSSQDGIKFDFTNAQTTDKVEVCTDGTSWFMYAFMSDDNHIAVVSS